MEKVSHIDFVLVADIEGMFFTPDRPEGFSFAPSGGLRFVLRPSDPKEDACGHREGLECKVFATYPATKDQTLFVESYIKHRKLLRVADGISLPFKPKDEVLISEDGSLREHFRPRRSLFPSDIIKLVELAESELSIQPDRFLALLRWRQGIDSAAKVVKRRTLYWKVGKGKKYFIAPLEDIDSQPITVQGMLGIRWDDVHVSDLQKLWDVNNLTEPLGHMLVREASVLASDSPRSSILIMTAALETAVKMHISRIAPDTAWLMEEVPSPPIFKILRDYIPLIHRNRGQEIVYWDKVKPSLKKVQKLIETRNKIAHTGRIPEDFAPIQDYLQLVSDLLYLLDVLDGHKWAKTLVSHELRQELGWPNPKDGRVTITITQHSY